MTKAMRLVLCTCPNKEVALDLAERVVTAHLAACVNIIPEITSIYTWKEKIEISTEQLLIIKTTQEVYTKLENLLLDSHPYECPEVIQIPIEQGAKGYLKWIENSVLP